MRKTLAILMAAAFAISACSSGGPAATGGASSPSVAAAPSFASDSTMGKIKAAGKLVCGTKFDVIAFGFKNPTTNEVDGFDADLCREVAKAIGVQPEFVEAVSANRLPFLKEDKVDIVISTMTRNEDRLKEIDFSKIYYVAGQKILVKSASPHKTVEDLVTAKVKVCSGEGSTSEKNLQTKGVLQSNIVLFKTYAEAAQALLDGRCEAVSTDDSILFGLASQNTGLEVRGEAFTKEPLGIGIKKGKDDLVKFINAVLDAMAADGRWKVLYDKNIKPYSKAEAPTPPLDQ
jgi:putative glutamine transport system substrate-binding protein